VKCTLDNLIKNLTQEGWDTSIEALLTYTGMCYSKITLK